MNILVVCHYGLYEDLSFSYVHAQAKAYAEQRHHVHVLIPIALGKSRNRCRILPLHQGEIVDGVHLHYIRYASLSNYGKKFFNTASAKLAVQTHCMTLLKQFAPDVIHAHTFGFDSEIGVLLKKKTGCPLVVTTHGSDVSIPFEQGNTDYLKVCCEHVDTVVGVSSALAGKVKSCGVDIPVVSIFNGFNLRHVPENRTKQPLALLQVSNLLAQKRVDVTIRAYAQVRQRYPEARLTIVGQGPERENLEKLCRELDVLDGVTFTGQISNERVLEEMAKAQYFAMPSVREGFGIVYLEAMACGCVTIGTQKEGIADLIVSGENGFLVPANDPDAIASIICRCHDCPDAVRAITERGQEAARALTWKTNAEKYVALFRTLIERKSDVAGKCQKPC